MSRAEFDNYPTPEPLPLAICERLRTIGLLTAPSRIVEPSAGAGAFVKAARATWPTARISAVDIRDTRAACLQAGADEAFVSDWPAWIATQRFDAPALVVGNPPFRLAEEHLRAAISALPPRSVVAMLLRLGFLGSEQRVPFFEKHPLGAIATIVPRPSYVDGQDYSEYGLFIWRCDYYGAGLVLPPIRWAKPSRRTRGDAPSEVSSDA